jgi:hypothetical protein
LEGGAVSIVSTIKGSECLVTSSKVVAVIYLASIMRGYNEKTQQQHFSLYCCALKKDNVEVVLSLISL